MRWDITQLPWLPVPPDDFRAACKAITRAQRGVGTELARLSGHRLNTDQLIVLSRAIRAAAHSDTDLAPLLPFRLAVLGNATTCLYVPTLEASGARHGMNLEVIQAPYDQVMQEALSPTSSINAGKPDAVLLALDYRAMPLHEGVYGDFAATENVVDKAIQYLRMIREGLQHGCSAPVIYQTIPHKPFSNFGNYGSSLIGTHRNMLARLNDHIRNLAHETSDYVLDIAVLAETVGLDRWHDAVQWNMYKLPFSQSIVPLYSDHVARMVATIRGRSRKCLVLDLDNTLWGGIIGDDGVGGIKLGEGSGIGEAFLDIQRTALSLRQRGVVLAICSKNEDNTAREPFRVHPEMILKEHHIASFHANWHDKASNLEAIARELNLGLDALVFLDDNPFERAQVRKALPMIAIPELPNDPAHYSQALLSAGYFETVSFTREDALRADLYQTNNNRTEVLKQGRDLTEYLKSLNMVIQFAPFDSINRPRIVQLINKTNQFNLTTKRYTESQVIEFEESQDRYVTLQVRTKDNFGEHGMIGVVICVTEDRTWRIDTWLMSCRVLGRCVEHAVLNELVRHGLVQGIEELVGEYTPTQKNTLVKDLFSTLGFNLRARNDDNGSTSWVLRLDRYTPFDTPFTFN